MLPPNWGDTAVDNGGSAAEPFRLLTYGKIGWSHVANYPTVEWAERIGRGMAESRHPIRTYHGYHSRDLRGY